MTTWPLICEMLSRMLSRTGCEIENSGPGMRCSRVRCRSAISCRLSTPFGHSFSGFNATSASIWFAPLASEPSSGRPSLATTVETCG